VTEAELSPNREQRRHPEKLGAAERQREQGEQPWAENPSRDPEEQMRADARQPDDLSVRAKSSGHGKKTADKWNQ
jgi:hypothetical protein